MVYKRSFDRVGHTELSEIRNIAGTLNLLFTLVGRTKIRAICDISGAYILWFA